LYAAVRRLLSVPDISGSGDGVAVVPFARFVFILL
jgi:hypothetical protein